MTLEFQDNILRFCVNARTLEGRKFFELLDDSCFDLPDRKFVFSLITKYIEKYQTMPSRVNLIEYFEIIAGKLPQLTAEGKNVMILCINELFQQNFNDTVIVRDQIIKFSQRKQSKELFKLNMDKVKDADDGFFDKMLREFGKIANLGKDLDNAQNRGPFLFRDFTGFRYSISDAHPTYLKGLNAMTASGGFKTPELIILMSQPKGFKTGTILNIAMNYVRDGLNVYYVDCENGIKAIQARAFQCMMNSTKRDLLTDDKEKVLADMVKRWKVMGGDFKNDFYPANICDCNDVEANLQYYWDEYGWKPDLIIWDYPDKMVPIDKSIKENRLRIQHVYHDIIRVHNKWSCFGFGISQVNKNAVNKEFIDMKDFAEDFGKAANAHAAFALCRTEDEIKAGTARLIPVMQREGEMFTGTQICYLQIDAPIQTVTEFFPVLTNTNNAPSLSVDPSKITDD